ncbi:molybdate transport system ATP-binding protein [Geosporobacter subterraneus DSM 17957]|uniref:Molybdate transport system ATP-binding protein n=1 Tax=Geosporobacter subterraneus DSM 17957 TaxID=1121919 RepID=A0A1M6EKT8_9FIRM|nr:ATP-binding cassette domain-containing protein [Geosporobacter subterraneus]SHI86064.1 molybdate transport system ATP-binding protein [Geosporobacter subterraneus DSM 17957]
MLEVNFNKSLGHFTLNSSFKADKGVLGILGSSGCGKSMTLKCIAGLYKPDKGMIKLNDRVLYCSDFKINIPSRNRNIGYVFQNYALFPHLTVQKNIAYGVKHLEKNERLAKVGEMIERMQLKGLENNYPSQLSGGQQQRTALARTLIRQPELLLLDEPFSALDTHIKYLLEKELVSIIKDNFDGIVLLVTHNIEEAYRICDNIMVIDQGQNLQYGKKEEIIHSPANVSTARITGCKNFLDVTVLEELEHEVVLKAKDLVFKAEKRNIPYSRNMVAGVRAHHLRLSSTGDYGGSSFVCDIVEKIEGVFSTTVIVNCMGCTFQVEVAKAACPHLLGCGGKKIKLHIPPHQVFLMKRET